MFPNIKNGDWESIRQAFMKSVRQQSTLSGITITGTSGCSGGGDLTANRTITNTDKGSDAVAAHLLVSNPHGITAGSMSHNSLAGLDGGVSGEYYHLSATKYGYIDQDITTTASPTFNKITCNNDGDKITGVLGVDSSHNNWFGNNTLSSLTSGSENNTIGYNSMLNNTTGSSNNAFGQSALLTNTTGSNNMAIGHDSLYYNETGSYNVGIGRAAISANTSGNGNTGIGTFCYAGGTTGSYNTSIGYNTSAGITTGSYNTIIGAQVSGLAANLSNNIILADGQGNIRLQSNGSGAITIGGSLSIGGNITVGGTVDGIDIATDVAANTTHRTSNGSDHSYINQNVTTSASPTFSKITTSNSGQGEYRGFDEHHSIIMREGAANEFNFYEYGGNLADSLGYFFYSGGLKASQTLRFSISNDKTAIYNPFVTQDTCQLGRASGTSSSYSEIEDDGTLVFHGDARVWDDQQVNIGEIAGNGWFGSAWSEIVEYRSGVALKLENSTSNGYKFKFNCQINHKYAEGEDIEFHVHIGDSSTSTGNIVLKLTYQWANMEGTYGSSTTVSKTIAIDGTDGKHQMEEIAATISGTGKEISSILLCQVERDAGNASDTFSGDVYVIGVDFHVPLDMVGSREEGTK